MSRRRSVLDADELEALLRVPRSRTRGVPAVGGRMIRTGRHRLHDGLRPRPAAFARGIADGLRPIPAAFRAEIARLTAVSGRAP